MINFVLSGYRHRETGILTQRELPVTEGYPVYEAEVISQDLIFGR